MTALSIGGLRSRASSLFRACSPAASSRPLPPSCRSTTTPVMLFALLLGMAMNFLSSEGPCQAGIGFTGREVLRIGWRCSDSESRWPR
jgi:hypothetical protein